ncbi:MAG: hypothetical protein O3A55_01465 [Bacteroidetes bacterium]|nr:hypothetical protein [Bacteroidota bacterium]
MRNVISLVFLFLLILYVDSYSQGGTRPPTGGQYPPGGAPQGPPPGGGQQPMQFGDVDSNHDGKISMDEAKAKFGGDPNWQTEFDNRDKNNDGYGS